MSKCDKCPQYLQGLVVDGHHEISQFNISDSMLTSTGHLSGMHMPVTHQRINPA